MTSLRIKDLLILAEREGFEPSVRFNVRLISSQVHSTTLPPLLIGRAPPCGGAKREIVSEHCTKLKPHTQTECRVPQYQANRGLATVRPHADVIITLS